MPFKTAPCQSDNFTISTLPDKMIAVTSTADGCAPFSFEVKNNLNKSIFYKVKVTSNYLFRISQPSGILESGETKKIEMRIHSQFGVPKVEDEHHVTLFYTFKPDDLVVAKGKYFSIRSLWHDIEAKKGPIEFRMFALTFSKLTPVPKNFLELPQRAEMLQKRRNFKSDKKWSENDKCLMLWINTHDFKSNAGTKGGSAPVKKSSSSNSLSVEQQDVIRSWILHRSYGICCDYHCEQFSDDDDSAASGAPKTGPGQRLTVDSVLRRMSARTMDTELYRQLMDEYNLSSTTTHST